MRIVLVLFLALVLSCSSDNGNGPPGDGVSDGGGDADFNADPVLVGDSLIVPIAALDLCERFIAVFCAAEQVCCTDLGSKYASEQACMDGELDACNNDLEPIFADVRVGYDPVLAGVRIAELEDLVATCDLAAGPWTVDEDGLLGVARGTVDGGGSCTPSGAGDGAALLSCRAPNECKLNLLLAGTCGTPSGNGGGCYTDLECIDGHYCDPPGNWFGGGGTCTPRQDVGACGTNGGACLSLICEGGLCVARTVNNTYCLDN